MKVRFERAQRIGVGPVMQKVNTKNGVEYLNYYFADESNYKQDMTGDYYPAADYEALQAENLKLTEFYNKFGNIQASEITQVSQLKAKLARLVGEAENFVSAQELVNTEGEKELISRSARPLIILLYAFNKLKAAIDAVKGR